MSRPKHEWAYRAQRLSVGDKVIYTGDSQMCPDCGETGDGIRLGREAREYPEPGVVGIVVQVGRYENNFEDFPWCMDEEGCEMGETLPEILDPDADDPCPDHVKVAFPPASSVREPIVFCGWSLVFRPVTKVSGGTIPNPYEHYYVLRTVYVGIERGLVDLVRPPKIVVFDTSEQANDWMLHPDDDIRESRSVEEHIVQVGGK